MIKSSFYLLTCLLLACAIPVTSSNTKRQLPQVTLPYGTWQAASYNILSDVYVFKNIRFAAPPLGNLRWELPQPPLQQTGIQDGSVGNICIQIPPSSLNASSSAASGTGALISVISAGNQSEDCLFLDVYVPGKFINGSVKNLPVIVWIYGGAYVEGSKDGGISLGLYDGSGPVYASGGNAIVVTLNYRLGPYGFLTGTTVENEGISNAGFHDQIAALKWVNKYISLFGGDPTNVSAWGESAGAGSIYWLLTQQGGTQDPFFHRAIVQSPAFQTNIDRNGLMEEQFQDFATLAGCGDQGLACLRVANASTLTAAAANFTWSPGPDGKYFRQYPTLEFAQGKYWKPLTSLILSHTIDEALIFLPTGSSAITTDAEFTASIESMLPPYAIHAGIPSQILAQYPPVNSTHSPYATEEQRLLAYTAQSSFLNNVRTLTTAYAGKTYNVQFSAFGGTHGSDILATWYNPFLLFPVGNLSIPFWEVLIPLEYSALDVGVAKAYQSYLVSHALTGNPNTDSDVLNVPPAINWPLVGDGNGEYLTNVLNVTDTGFELITDMEDYESVTRFWVGIFEEITALGGYSP